MGEKKRFSLHSRRCSVLDVCLVLSCVLFGYIFTLLNLFLRYCMMRCNDDFLTLTFTPLQKIPAMLLHCVERVFLAKKKKVRLPHQEEKKCHDFFLLSNRKRRNCSFIKQTFRRVFIEEMGTQNI